MTAVDMEARKIKRKHYRLMASGTITLQLSWLATMVLKRSAGVVGACLIVLSLARPPYLGLLLMPVATALLTFRLVTLDMEERTDQLLAIYRQWAAIRFTAELVMDSANIAAGGLSFAGFLASAEPGLGLRSDAGYQGTLLSGLVMLLAAPVITVAVQLVLAAYLEKQVIGLGVATMAGVTSSILFSVNLTPLDWALPWEPPATTNPVSTQLLRQTGTGTTFVTHPRVSALEAVPAAAIWVCISRLVIRYKENHR